MGDSRVAFDEEALPLIVCVMPTEVNAGVVDQMATGYERLFQRGERYALVSCSRPGGAGVLAKERRLIADWANLPRVRTMSAKLCVGSATLVESPIERAVLTAILWFWTPTSPHRTTGTPAESVDFCLERMAANGLVCPMPRERLIRHLRTQMTR